MLMKPSKTTRLIYIFAGFAVIALVLHLLIPSDPYVADYTEKLSYYRENAEDVSVLFIGSSRVRRHVDPVIFDEIVARSGSQMRSYNLGVDAMNLIELKTLIEEVVSIGSPTLKYVFIGPVFVTNLPVRNLTTRRVIHFHDLDNTLLEIRSNLSSAGDRRSVTRSALACLYHYANLGRLASMLHPEPDPVDLPALIANQRITRGFRAADDHPSPAVLKWRTRMLDNAALWREKLAADKSLPEIPRPQYVERNEELFRLAGILTESGVTPIFLITPAMRVWPFFHFLEYRRRHDPASLLFSYLTGYDEIYEFELWHDEGHLTGDAARRFTRRFANDFVRFIEEGGSE